MAKNPIDVIRDAEIEAEKILGDAQVQSACIKEEAYALAAQTKELAESAAKATADETISEARQRSQCILRDAEAAIEDELEALRRQALSKQEQAVDSVIASLV